MSLTVLTAAVTSPLPEQDITLFSTGTTGPGLTCSSTVGLSEMKVWNWKSGTVTLRPASPKTSAA